MGQACAGQNDKLETSFTEQLPMTSQLEWEDYRDQELHANYSKYPSDAPSKSYGKPIDRRPKLFQLVENSRRNIGEIEIPTSSTQSIQFPLHYIKKYQAYYQGGWKNGEPEGLGKLYFNNGSYFEGPFTKGIIGGNDGIFIYPNGSYKRGHIVNGELNGQGIFVTNNGFKYEGEWLDDQPHGRGREIYPDYSYYEGCFYKGLKEDDNGMYRWSSGKQYNGPFREGYMEGHGRLFMRNGRGEYIGMFSRNLKVGRGALKTETGDYEGNFVNGEFQGTGTFTWLDQKKYVGEFSKGELHGNGTMYYPNGQIVKGVWYRGENEKISNIGRQSLA